MSSSKSKKSSKKVSRPTFSIVLLVAFIVAVFAFIGHRQVRSAEERRLRLLAGFANRIETTVPDLADRFRRIAARRCADQVEEYLGLVPHVEPLTIRPSGTECPGDGEAPSRGREEIGFHAAGGAVTVRYCAGGDCDFEGAGAELRLDDRRVAAAEARIRLDDVLEPMIIPGIFDSVVIADRSGSVLHQRGEPGLKVAHLGALLGVGEPRRGEAEAPGRDGSFLVTVAEEGGRAGRLVLRALGGGGGEPAPPGGPGTATAILETKIADADYSVFIQPVILAIEPEEGQPTPEPERWVAVGVISSEHLLSAGVTTSPILLFLLVSILPLGLIAWPFLKLGLISRRQPFTRLDCAFLVLATVLVLAFGALLLVDGLLVTRVQASVDRQLADLSRVIGRNFRMELLDARLQLEALNRTVELAADDTIQAAERADDGSLQKVPSYFGTRDEESDGGPEGEQTAGATRRSARIFIEDKVSEFLSGERELRIYPYFDSVFWPDSDGDVNNATVPLREHAVLPQNVADRDYVQCAEQWDDPVTLGLLEPLEGLRSEEESEEKRTLWKKYRESRCGEDGGEDPCPLLHGFREGAGRVELCVDSLLDRTTGEPVAAVSMPGPGWEKRRFRRWAVDFTRLPFLASVPATPLDDWRTDRRPTAALVAQLTSLHHPVLPPEVQFAVVEPSGHVLFHSDSRRAETENFLEASDENNLLRALLHSRREGDLTLHYWGRRHRAHLRPIPGLPWSLVVFRGIEDLRLRNFELIYDFLNPFVLHLGVLALLATVFRWIAPRRFRTYLWPSTQNLAAYRRIVWWTLGVSIVFVVLLAADDLRPRWLFLASFLVVPVSFFYAVWFLPALHRALDDQPSPVRWLVRLWRRGARKLRKLSGNGGKAAASQDQGSPGGGKTPEHRELSDELRRRKGVRWAAALPGLALTLVFLWSGCDAMASWLFGTAWAVAVGLWWFWPEFGGSRRRIAYTFALGCMLLLSLLPALGFLDLARSRQAQLTVQDTTVALAHRLEAREREIDGRQGPLASYYGAYQEELRCVRDSYLGAAGSAVVPDGAGAGGPICRELVGRDGGPTPPGAGGSTPDREGPGWLWPYGKSERPELSRLDRWAVHTLSARPVSLNDLSPQPAGVDLSRFRARVGDWRRTAGGNGESEWVVLETLGHGLPESLHLATVAPGVEAFPEGSVGRALAFGVGLVLLGIAPFLLARHLAKKLLLIDLVYSGDDPLEAGTGAEGETRAGRVAASRPAESLEDVLDEAQKGGDEGHKGGRVVKRLVIVAGQLERAGWAGMVTEPGGEDRGPGGDGAADPPSRGGEGAALGFHEARFRETWDEVVKPAADTQAEASRSPETLGLDGGRLDDAEGVEPSRQVAFPPCSRRFEEALTRGAAPGQPILLTHFAPDLQDVQTAVDQTLALRNLVERDERSLVILSDVVPVTTDESPGVPDSETAVLRWIELLGSFPVRYARDFNHLDDLHGRADGARRLIVKTWQEDQERLGRKGTAASGGEDAAPGRQDAATGPRGESGAAEKESLHILWARAQHWKWIVETIESECKHTPTLRVLGHQLLSELFVDMRRANLEGQIRTLEAEPDKIRHRLPEIELRLQEIPGEIQRLHEEKGESGEENDDKLSERATELRDEVVALTGEYRELTRRLEENPGELEEANRDLGRIERRSRNHRRFRNYRNLLTEDHVLARIGAGARLHYRYLWSHCNRDEKLVLVQLAQQGLVNPKSFGWVVDLMQRGLVIRAPDLRLMNESFRRFVLQEFRRSDALEWEDELGPNAWSVFKWILPFPLLALAGFLFITQRDAVSNAAGVLVALASLTPVVFNLYGKFQEINLRRERLEGPAKED